MQHSSWRAFLRRHAILIAILATVLLAVVSYTSVVLYNQYTQVAETVVDPTSIDAQAQPAGNVPTATTSEKVAEAVGAGCRATTAHSNPDSIDIVVNKKNCIQPLMYVPGDMQIVIGATLSTKAVPNFLAMHQAATEAGLPFDVSSSYRSYDQQVATYAYWVGVSSQAEADTVSARAGYSEHQTGLTVDLSVGSCYLDCFTSTAQRTWLQEHAADYGFIQRYPAGQTAVTGYAEEPWHYRYVGVATAVDMKKRGVATLEEYWHIPGGDYAS